jgi:hypothetical protein
LIDGSVPVIITGFNVLSSRQLFCLVVFAAWLAPIDLVWARHIIAAISRFSEVISVLVLLGMFSGVFD